jgi:hypothetical protein
MPKRTNETDMLTSLKRQKWIRKKKRSKRDRGGSLTAM